MNLLYPASASKNDKIQSRLLVLAFSFLSIQSIILTLAPVVRFHGDSSSLRWFHWLGMIVWIVGTSIIHRRLMATLPECDPYIFPIISMLSGWGLLVIYRLDGAYGIRQTIWLALSFCLLYFSTRFTNLLVILRKYKYILLTSGIILVGLTFFLGTYPSGTGPNLWLGCCGIYFQPSEPLKLLMVIFLAGYLADQSFIRIKPISLIIPSAILVGLATSLILAQQDLGTALILMMIYFAILFLGIGRRRILGIAGIIILVAGIGGYLTFDVIKVRVEAWIHPWLDTGGNSYQVLQSLMGIANGGVLGSGIGLGSPGFIPVAISDFIFSAVSEEYGLIGSIGMILLYAILIIRSLMMSYRTHNPFRRFLSAGIAIYLAVQTILIMGGNNRLLPITGVTLPFVSYGGSSLLTTIFAAYLLMISCVEENEVSQIDHDLKPFSYLSMVVVVGFTAVALINGWWAIFQADNLLSREDNPRRSLNDRFVLRGRILDRTNKPLVTTVGELGSYLRLYEYPQLSPVLGYANPVYGLAGIERSMDGYLRGLQGNPSSVIISRSLLYNQPPIGLDVRLSIDLEYQEIADDLLGDHTGSIILIQANSGEILASASHPNVDPNSLESNWGVYVNDSRSPFINRSVQGLYPPATITGPFFMAYAFSIGSLPDNPQKSSLVVRGRVLECAQPPDNPDSWRDVITSGCPYGVLSLAEILGDEIVRSIYPELGWEATISLPISVAAISPVGYDQPISLISVGESGHLITPLHAALAAAALSTDGNIPAPLLATGIKTPHQGWVILPTEGRRSGLPKSGSSQAIQALAVEGEPYWMSLATSETKDGPVTWCIGGTITDWQGAPLAVAVVLEENSPNVAGEICSTLLDYD